MNNLSNRISTTKYALECLKRRQEISDKYNIPIEQILDLSLGDNLFIPPSLIQKILVKEIQTIDPRDSYPIDYFGFIDEISRFMGIKADSIYAGVTHNLLIQQLVLTIAKAEDSIVLLNPDKEIYSKIAKDHSLVINTLELEDDFELDSKKVIEFAKETKAKLIVFSSPHYPTANQFKEEEILAIVKGIKIPVIIDESYVEFGKYSLVNQTQNYDNLTVVRSFSKAWGLGSVSCAFLVSNPDFINMLKESYFIEEIPPIHLLASNYILQNPYKFVELINNFISERKRVIEHLRMLSGLRVYKSDTNFLFIKFKNNVDELYEQLCSKGIIIQTFSDSESFKDSEKSFLVTLGDMHINDRFIVAIMELLESIL